MTTTLAPPSRTTNNDIDRCLDALSKGSRSTRERVRRGTDSTGQGVHRRDDPRRPRVGRHRPAAIKDVAGDEPLRAEDMMRRPVATIRHLRLVIQSLRDIAGQRPAAAPRPPDDRHRRPSARSRLSRQGDVRPHHVPGIQSRIAWMKPGITNDSLPMCPEGTPRPLESRQSANLPSCSGRAMSRRFRRPTPSPSCFRRGEASC